MHHLLLGVQAVAESTEKAGEAEQMVSVKMSDEDLGDLARLDTTLLKLDLRAFTAVKYPDTSVILIRDWRRSGREVESDFTQLKSRTGNPTAWCGETTGGLVIVTAFISIRKGVNMGVVDQGVVTISPGELLGPTMKNYKSQNQLISQLT